MAEWEQAPEVALPRAAPGDARRLLFVAAAWAALVGGFQLYAWHEMLSAPELAERLVGICRTSSGGPLLFIGAALLSPLLLMPAALLGGIAGACFGPVLGVVITLIGCNLSALLTYTLGRLSGRSNGRIAQLSARYGRRLQQRPFLGVIVLRLSFLPYDPVNYLVGLLKVGVRPFLLANTLGSLPGVIAIVLAGSAVGTTGHRFSIADLGVAPVVLALIVLGVASAVVLRRRTTHAA